MDAPPPRRPGIKLKIPPGNVPNSYNDHPGQPNEGGWNLRPAPARPSLSTGSSSTAVPQEEAYETSSSIMATPPPRRPILNGHTGSLTSNNGGAPKLSLVTSRGEPNPRGPPPLSIGSTSTSTSTSSGSTTRKAPALSLNIPIPGSKPSHPHPHPHPAGLSGSAQPSPVYDEFGGIQTAYHGGMRTPTKGYDTGQTTIGRLQREEYDDDEGQRTVKGMTADLRNALSQMRITPAPTPGGSTRGSLDGGSVRSGQDGSGSEDHPGLSLGRSTSRGSGRTGSMKERPAGGVEDELDPRNYETLMRLGEGAGGAVEKVKDKRTGKILAMKVITTSPNPAIHKQLLRELQFLNECQSPYVVEHYGSFLTSSDTCIGILMEFCEAGSLDTLVRKITRRGGRTSEKVLGKIAEAVLGGLDYLHERKIIHRDIKPSNILVTRGGQVKLCDFGVSGELVDSFAGTFTGTSFYMAPERIQGLSYSIKSDIWSLGLTLHEVAHNRFPFPPEGEPPLGGPIELLNFIVAQPVPRLINSPEQRIVWTNGAQDFLAQCLIRSANERPYPRDLLKHPWIVESSKRNVNLAKWVTAIHGWE